MVDKRHGEAKRMSEQNPAREEQGPGPADVLAAVGERIVEAGTTVDRLEIRQATPYEYTYRLYPTPDDEFEGGVVTFER